MQRLYLLIFLLELNCSTKRPTFKNKFAGKCLKIHCWKFRRWWGNFGPWSWTCPCWQLDQSLSMPIQLTAGCCFEPGSHKTSKQVWSGVCEERYLRSCRVGWRKLLQDWKRAAAEGPEQAQNSQTLWAAQPREGRTPGGGNSASWVFWEDFLSPWPREKSGNWAACQVLSSLELGYLRGSFWCLGELTICQGEPLQSTRAKTAMPSPLSADHTWRQWTAGPKTHPVDRGKEPPHQRGPEAREVNEQNTQKARLLMKQSCWQRQGQHKQENQQQRLMMFNYSTRKKKK